MSARVSFATVEAIDVAVISAPLFLTPMLAASLTPSEREVATLLLSGRDYADIATLRGTAARTVANQVRSIFRKLGVGSRSELLRLAVRATEES